MFLLYFSKKNRIRRLVAKYSVAAQLCRERDQYLKNKNKIYYEDDEWNYLHYQEIILALKLDDIAGIGMYSAPPILYI